jgi:adenylyltransferase/sulfurtransferase
VGWDDALRLLEKEGGLLLDVREEEELPALSHPALRRAPLSRMQGAAPACEGDGPIFVCCQTGVRSLSAAERLSEAFPQRMVRSIRGGVRGLGAEAQLFLPK